MKPILRSIFFVLLSLALFSGCAKQSPYTGDNADEALKNCLQLSAKKRYEEAVECFEILKSRYPRSVAGQEAELKIADMHFQQREFLLAAEAYEAFIALYPRSPKIGYAHYRAGVSYFREIPKAIDRDQEYIDDAVRHFETVVNRYPRSSYRGLAGRFLKEARLRIAKRHFYVGRFYSQQDECLAAIPRFNTIVSDYLDSGLAPQSLYLMTTCSLKLENLEAAKSTFGVMALEYPGNRWTKKAEKKLLKASKRHLIRKEP